MTQPIDPKEIASFITDDPDVFNEADWGWASRGESPPDKETDKERHERVHGREEKRKAERITWNKERARNRVRKQKTDGGDICIDNYNGKVCGVRRDAHNGLDHGFRIDVGDELLKKQNVANQKKKKKQKRRTWPNPDYDPSKTKVPPGYDPSKTKPPPTR